MIRALLAALLLTLAAPLKAADPQSLRSWIAPQEVPPPANYPGGFHWFFPVATGLLDQDSPATPSKLSLEIVRLYLQDTGLPHPGLLRSPTLLRDTMVLDLAMFQPNRVALYAGIVPIGCGCRGVPRAAELYFHTSPAKLSLR